MGVLVLRVFQFLVHAGCTRGFVGEGRSPWALMFFGVVVYKSIYDCNFRFTTIRFLM